MSISVEKNNRPLAFVLALAGLVVIAAVLIWQGIVTGGAPDPSQPQLSRNSALLQTAILVFREGLECIIVLAALTASLVGANQSYRRPVALGVGIGSALTLATWFLVVAIISQIDVRALDIQAGTGLLAIVILLIVMNWFFHKIYWTGWISMHSRRRHDLISGINSGKQTRLGFFWGMVFLGLTSVYREGFEVVLFLQSVRLQVGTETVFFGAAIGLVLTLIFGALTFWGQHRLPYKDILVLTGILLGGVMVVMVGESVQEMQLASWISTTSVSIAIPAWMGTWFAIFPNLEGLIAQFLSAIFVAGSYFMAEYMKVKRPRSRGEKPAERATVPPVGGSII
jgi:high-affinity iron transporter